ncbi:MAG: hypothetical protein ACOH1Q_02795 [Thiobacillus sp.]
MTQDEELFAALRASRFAELTRMLINEDMKYSSSASPTFYKKLSSNLSAISDDEIERLTLPMMRKQVPIAAARSALKFFSSAPVSVIAGKLVGNQPPNLTDAETVAYSAFVLSVEGAPFFSFWADNMVLAHVFKAIQEH